MDACMHKHILSKQQHHNYSFTRIRFKPDSKCCDRRQVLKNWIKIMCIKINSYTQSLSSPALPVKKHTGNVAREHRCSQRYSAKSVTAKHAYTLCMWLCMKWHGAWLYGVHRTCAEMAAVSCGTSHASAVSTPLRWIVKNALYINS